MPHVYCSVDNCHYWAQGNVCHASEILVTADAWAAEAPDTMDASQHMEVPTASAQTCMDTCCKTFVAKGSDAVEVDNITKN
ncbi:MAG TPA: DUF1540 domain-containing protein [Firmicutes bacterium]|nr:DUF1540 domain-containing protein [Bacillota bacterium]